VAALLAAWLPDRQALARVLELEAELRDAASDTDGARAARSAVEGLRQAGQPAAAAPLPAALALETPHRAAYDEAFQAGITALQGRRLPESIAHFRTASSSARPAASALQPGAEALAGHVPEASHCCSAPRRTATAGSATST
jgi:hypothetical protein